MIRRKILTLANQITIVRIIMIPVIVILLLQQKAAIAGGLLVFSILTDLLDGMVARLKNETTEIGAFLDPMADKLLITAVYLTLAYLSLIPMWVFVVIFSRDLLIVLGWGVIHILTNSSAITPRLLGKATTAIQMMASLAFVVRFSPEIHSYMIWTILVTTVASVIDYIIVGEKRLGEWG